jgi:hypothetical protein
LAFFIGTITTTVASGASADMRFPAPPLALFDNLFSTPFTITLLFGFVISAKEFEAAGVTSLGTVHARAAGSVTANIGRYVVLEKWHHF